MGKVEVRDYDPEWVRAFERVRDYVAPAVASAAVAIEHVGSTSVFGLAAKPIVDVDIVVRDADGARAAIAGMESLGFQHRGDLGVPGREAFTKLASLPAANIYVVLQDCTAYRNHIALRDWLRAHPEDATRYGALKHDLAKKFSDDIDAYIDGKTDLILDLLRKAGMESGELDDVEQINRLPN